MTTPLKHYLATIEAALKAGNATEHTHRPALKALLESMDLGLTATNEPKRIACGAPDYILTRNNLIVGYIEAKDVGKSLAETERSEQLKRYRRALDNLVLTDYLEFRWYVGGELRQEARLAQPQPGGKLKPGKDSLAAVESLLQAFLAHQPQGINTPKDLAERLARLTHIIRDIIVTAFETGQASPLLQGWREAFAKVLIADLSLPERTPDFADMFAQTLAYGLFTARVMDPTPVTFTRQKAQYLIPKSNPFLRDFFIQISGPQLDDEPFASFVDDLVNLLAHTDMAAVLADFGRRTRQEDPVVHFYETFLAAYDPRLREARGVYYTPEPVVSYIVRSVDALLKSRFDCPQGLADSSQITIPNYDPGLKVKGKNETRKTIESHKVLVLDPATGTGTFLYAVIDHIRQQFMQQDNAGLWPGYVKNHLLPRLFGFELLMAPYAVAHFKLSLQLAGRDLPEPLRQQWAYLPAGGERLGVYLTNALEEPHEMTGLPLFTQWVADETNAANEVKRHLPVLVVMGNPPYSGHSANKSAWIDGLLHGKLPDGGKTGSYYEVDGQPLGEKNPKWLQDDYVKFLRFGQWRIERSGQGILAFISNNGYLDNPTFRGMRQALMQSFSEIYILNLHGNAKKKETAPDGGKDENVFDIQQGVGIGIFVKQPGKTGPAQVYHADLWGVRAKKYEQLFEQDVTVTGWQPLNPQAPFYLFTPQNVDLLAEYNQGWKLTDIFPTNSVGIVTARDRLTIHWTRDEIWQTVNDFAGLSVEEARTRYDLGQDARDWKVHLAQADVTGSGPTPAKITPILYRPFDVRFTYYTGRTKGFHCMPRPEVMRNMLNGDNLGLIFMRQVALNDSYSHFGVSKVLVDNRAFYSNKGIMSYAPLYLYPTGETGKQKGAAFNLDLTGLQDLSGLAAGGGWPPDAAHGGRTPNLNPAFVKALGEKLGLTFQPVQTFEVLETSKVFGPEDIFHYIYALFHSPTYRSRYAEFLKIDFPRVPLTSNVGLFRTLGRLGRELVGLHLLDFSLPLRGGGPGRGSEGEVRYPVTGDNRVEKGYPKYTPPLGEQPGRVYLNKSQYFEGVAPEVWGFYVGGYQVLEKWLKDRQGRQLSYDELTHYRQIVAALGRTIELMAEIDSAIPQWPLA
ncbi:MAG: DNA methyltransferase [Anaerolineales bacterium]|nr:DNA methyltransferase [Anaerolineales bacterium]